MQLEDLRNKSNKSISLNHRGWAVDASFNHSVLSLNFKYEGEPEGVASFEEAELPSLVEMLKAFFPKGDRGIRFDYEAQDQSSEKLPMVRLTTTNWGEPYAQGIRFTFSSDFEDYSLDNLHFDLEESDAKQLLHFTTKLFG
tara:strand:- start:721 stop:1143 length:423 start_codon:yes stop_codon:yes gene_type:complete